VGVGRDWTIYSLIAGHVSFDQNGRRINVLPEAELAGKRAASKFGWEAGDVTIVRPEAEAAGNG
jgi:hypothetical protein